MAERNERVVLNELIVTCRDAARGFEWAADHVHDRELRALFLKIASERHQHVMDLLPHAIWLGGVAPEGDGTRLATFHRAWMAMRDHLAPHHDYAIVVEAERGDHAALAIYNNALNAGLPPEALRLIQSQRASVQAALASLQGSMPTA